MNTLFQKIYVVFNFFTSCIYLCKKSYLISGIPECSTNENTLLYYIFNIIYIYIYIYISII